MIHKPISRTMTRQRNVIALFAALLSISAVFAEPDFSRLSPQSENAFPSIATSFHIGSNFHHPGFNPPPRPFPIAKYFTTRGEECRNINTFDIPNRIEAPEYCTYINYRGANFNSNEREYCSVVQRVSTNFNALGSYYSVKLLRDAWQKFGSGIRYAVSAKYLTEDPFQGCVPLTEMPDCFQREQSGSNYYRPPPFHNIPHPPPRPLPRIFPMLQECDESQEGRNRRNNRQRRRDREVREFCRELESIKREWDRDGPLNQLVTKVQTLWVKYETVVKEDITEEIPFFFRQF